MVSLEVRTQSMRAAATRANALRRVQQLAVPVGLYLLALFTLISPVVVHPDQPYNWEPYSVAGSLRFWDDPTWSIFRPTGGLMTDSGDAPIIILPAWLGFRVAGISLDAMRVPVSAIAALAPLLLLFVGRRLASERVAVLAAALLAISPAFIVYGRSATNVGISLVPVLATIYALTRVIACPNDYRWLVALQIGLAAGLYVYAPGRFLWLIVLGLLFLEMALRREATRAMAIAFGVTLVVLPAFLTVVMRTSPPAALESYYNGRGEHLLAMRYEPQRFELYVEMTDEERATDAAAREPNRMALRLIGRNVRDLTYLLLDIRTRPAISDYWNAHGRLYALPLVPFFLIGLLASASRVRSDWRARVVLALFFGFSLPLLLTSQVHIGRLMFALPILLLLVAIGLEVTTNKMSALLRPARRFRVHIYAGCALGLVLLCGILALREYRQTMPDTWQTAAADVLRSELPVLQGGRSGALLLNRPAPLELIDVAEFRLALHDEYRFVDIRDVYLPVDDNRPLIFYGQLFPKLVLDQPIPDRCSNVYFVSSTLEPAFVGSAEEFWRECSTPLRFLILPP